MKKDDRSARIGEEDKPVPPLPDANSELDPEYSILAAVVDIVPASRWTFAQVDPKGRLASVYDSQADAAGSAALTDELRRQSTKSSNGPRISATLGSLGDFASGITLVFADAREIFGILMLLRSADIGPFTSIEISLLTLALDAVSDVLSALRMQGSRHAAATPGHSESDRITTATAGAFFILDSDLQIVLGWRSDDRCRIARTGLHTRSEERLPSALEETVRDLTSAWAGESVKKAGVAHPVPFLVVRAVPMSGPAGLFAGVWIDRSPPPNSLRGAAARFHISPREVQVLALLLDGNQLGQIAKKLHISSSTVQDHIKRMLKKTASSNRSELIARVLGWGSVNRGPEASEREVADRSPSLSRASMRTGGSATPSWSNARARDRARRRGNAENTAYHPGVPG